METGAGVTATRGGSLRIPSPSSASKEWRAVLESNAGGNSTGDVDLEQLKMERTDERTIYEHGREPLDVDFCSITVDDSSDGDILQQRLRTISRQKEELEQLEVVLRAQIIAKNQIMELQNSFETQMKEHANAAAKIQEQLHEKERSIQELERKMEEKDRELHAIKLDNEAAWAKEDLLREQNQELASFRRERDQSEAERSQQVQQIRELQDHIQEKERQLNELQEQHRLAQENILYKDDQLREAQGWINRAQEMDALQSSTNHSLQVELRERSEQYNQLWLGCQRQFAEMERLHLHTVQQLQLELAHMRERSGSYLEESHLSRANSNSASQFVQNSGNQFEANGSSATAAKNNVHAGGKILQNIPSLTSSNDTATENNHAAGLLGEQSSLLGMHAYLQAAQMTPLPSFVMNQQGIPHPVQPQGPSSHAAHSVLPQQWQQHKNHAPPSQGDRDLVCSDATSEYQVPVNGQSVGQGYPDAQNSQGAQPGSAMSSPSVKAQALESVNGDYQGSSRSDNNLKDISSQFCSAVRLNSDSPNQKPEDPNCQMSLGEQNGSIAPLAATVAGDITGTIVPETLLSSGGAGTYSESAFLDERSLLACIVRTIPAGGRIRIDSTLPNRLGKMLAPLHWHDYRRKYGKLDDFVSGYPELFMIEDDFIQLHEGAQKMVAASAAAAKVAAAAATSLSPHSMYVAMTPMAQSHGVKKNEKTVPRDATAPNGVHYALGDSISNVKILTKPRDLMANQHGSNRGAGVSGTSSRR